MQIPKKLLKWINGRDGEIHCHKGFEVKGWFGDSHKNWYKNEIRQIKNGTIVEIGVYGGASLLSITDICIENNNVIFGIDPWEKVVLWGGVAKDEGNIELEGDLLNIARNKMQTLRINLEKIIKHLEYKNINLIHEFSTQASNDFDKESVDFVFIDGNHSYEDSSADIKAWFDKVKPGGIMDGHDYSRHAPGVVNSVVEFSQKHNLNIISKTKEIWQIVKPN